MKTPFRLCAWFLFLTISLPFVFACQETPKFYEPEDSLRLAENGYSPYRIVISKDASEDTVTIAKEFTSY